MKTSNDYGNQVNIWILFNFWVFQQFFPLFRMNFYYLSTQFRWLLTHGKLYCNHRMQRWLSEKGFSFNSSRRVVQNGVFVINQMSSDAHTQQSEALQRRCVNSVYYVTGIKNWANVVRCLFKRCVYCLWCLNAQYSNSAAVSNKMRKLFLFRKLKTLGI